MRNTNSSSTPTAKQKVMGIVLFYLFTILPFAIFINLMTIKEGRQSIDSILLISMGAASWFFILSALIRHTVGFSYDMKKFKTSVIIMVQLILTVELINLLYIVLMARNL